MTDFDSSRQFVHHLLALDATFRDGRLTWRAITSPVPVVPGQAPGAWCPGKVWQGGSGAGVGPRRQADLVWMHDDSPGALWVPGSRRCAVTECGWLSTSCGPARRSRRRWGCRSGSPCSSGPT
ncbi:DUF2165 domain-containing protein [Streptacidiphilus sp. 4-A2]|nr:DUF2165 domain-containing protein [Streptacidiphilus sp. 4-A2]